MGSLSGAGPRTVVINDDPAQLRWLAGLLEGEGHRVTGFQSPTKALDELRAMVPPELLVLDLHMPELDGWKLCRLLRSPDFPAFRDIPILVVSSTFSGVDAEAISADLGANAFLSIPFDLGTFRSFLSELLAGRRPARPVHVLVVEDDDAVRRAIAEGYRRHGYEVAEARYAAEALKALRVLHPEVLVIDYHLPDGKGEDLLEHLPRGRQAPVTVVVSGDDDDRLPARMLRLGAGAFVRKPFEPGYLMEMTERALRERALLRVEDVLEERTQALRASEDRYRTVVHSLPDGVLVLNRNGVLQSANPAGLKLLGISAATAVPLVDLLPEEERDAVRMAIDGVRHGRGGTFELSLGAFDPTISSSGERRVVEASGGLVHLREGGEVILILRDVTERKAAEEERTRLQGRAAHSQRLESLGVLAGGIAHDFNNLLVGILGNAGLARMDLPPDHPSAYSLRQIEVAARRAADLTQQILAFSGKASTAQVPVSLPEVVREMAALLQPAVSHKAQLRFELDEEAPALLGDPSQLRQVIMNLIMNASDALGGRSGVIRVRTGHLRPEDRPMVQELRSDHLPDGPVVFIEVTDTGEGMPPETMDRIFDPFFTTKVHGRGLGLAATQGVVRTHRGAILVESTPGAGTTFCLYFPAAERRAPTSHVTPRLLPRSLQRGGRILVVDDDDDVRTLAESVLRRSGFEVRGVECGRTALEALMEDEGGVDAVLLDLSMPGMDGGEVLEVIRDRWGGLPVVLTSGHAAQVLTGTHPLERANGFLQKPYSPSELLEEIGKALAGRERMAASGS